jgi:hypothetical protein
MTKYKLPVSVTPKSNRRTVFGEVSRAIAFASRRKRSIVLSRLLSPSRSGLITFTAHGRVNNWCRPRHTSPMPPSPSFSISR